MNRQEAEKIKPELWKAFKCGYDFADIPMREEFEIWFDKTYPLEPVYIPFEHTDFNEFMLKEVRRKGENFKNEIWFVIGVTEKIVLITENLKDPSEQWYEKLFKSMLDEWEFSDGKPFGKIKND